MRKVDVKFLRPGQVVADVVSNPSGAVLCPIGFQLTQQAIERLKNANVGTVWIEGNNVPSVDVHAKLADLHSRFDGIEDPILLEIKGLLERRYNALKEEYGLD